MSSGKSKVFFTKLKNVVANINQEVEEVQKKVECSKYELPENSAILKLVEDKESIDSIKDASHKISEEIKEKDTRFFQYHQHVEELVAEMGDKMFAIEDYFSGFGYKKFPGKCEESPEVSEQENETEPDVMSYQTPLKGIMKTQTVTTGKENRIACSLKKTPLLIDYGLQSKFTNCLSEQKVDEQSAVKSIRKKLRFQTPLSTISSIENKNVLKYAINEEDEDTFEITEEFRNKIRIAGAVGDNNLCSSKHKVNDATDDVTPEDPTILSCRKRNLIQCQMADDVTPEDPTILSCRKRNMIQSQTVNEDSPVDPCPTPSSVYVPCESSTPKSPVLLTNFAKRLFYQNCLTPCNAYTTDSQSSTPEEPVMTSTIKDWLCKN